MPRKRLMMVGRYQGSYMATRRTRKSMSLAVKSMELALAVPQVVAHRLARMAIAGPTLSRGDLKEFEMMVDEKYAAYAQAWSGIAMHAFRTNQALLTTMFSLFFSFFTHPSKWPSAASASAHAQNAFIGLLSKGLTPIHRKAVSNVKRLSRARRK
jgi:hypothetical protein